MYIQSQGYLPLGPPPAVQVLSKPYPWTPGRKISTLQASAELPLAPLTSDYMATTSVAHKMATIDLPTCTRLCTWATWGGAGTVAASCAATGAKT